MNTKKIYFLVGLIVLILMGVFLWSNRNTSDFAINEKNKPNPDWKCLGAKEVAEYKINKKEDKVSTATISVKNIDNKEVVNKFEVSLTSPGHYHPVEIHKCAVYVVRSSNYDYSKRTSLPNYRADIWRYDYDGMEDRLVLLAQDLEGNMKGYEYFYSTDFRVDPLERYVTLEKSYMGKDDYALVIKDLATKQDVFGLRLQELYEQDNKLMGNFGMLKWTRDGRYFWGRIFGAAQTLGFYRIDTKKWQYELYHVPEGLMGGEQLNVETGWVTYHTDLVWTGVHEMQEEIKQERRQQGVGTKFYLYNLHTQKQILVYETNEPLFFTQPKWISESEVEYKVESGERRVYKLD